MSLKNKGRRYRAANKQASDIVKGPQQTPTPDEVRGVGLAAACLIGVDIIAVVLPFTCIALLYFARDQTGLITLIYKVPIILLCLGIVFLFAWASFGMLHLLQLRYIRQAREREDLALIGNIIAAAGIFYALVMGVIATATWDDFKLVSESVQKEVGAAGNMFEFSSGYSSEYRETLRKTLQEYIHHVHNTDWPAQSLGKPLNATHTHDLTNLISTVIDFDPKLPKEQVIHPVMLGELGKLIDARDARVRAITGVALPEVLWVVVSGCSFIVLLMVCWGPAQEKRPPRTLVGCWGALVGFVVFFTIAMDHPLWGELSVSRQPYIDLEAHWAELIHQKPSPLIPGIERPSNARQ